MSKEELSDNKDNSAELPRFLDDIECIERKRVKLESLERKRWSLSEKQSAQDVLNEMGVGLLDPEDSVCSLELVTTSGSMVNSAKKRTRDIENVNPNAQSPSRKKIRLSPKSRRSPTSETKSPLAEQLDEETPLPLQALNHEAKASLRATSPAYSATSSAGSSRHTPRVIASNASEYQSSSKESLNSEQILNTSSEGAAGRISDSGGTSTSNDAFVGLSDEVMLTIFKWLPKRTLAVCMLVCRRWHRIASDDSFWSRLELGNRVLAKGAIGRILAKQPTVVRLASSEIGEWRNPLGFSEPSKIQYLDLSMAIVDVGTLNALLERCPQLKKLSLESATLDQYTCKLIGRCSKMETLNLTMTNGITPDGISSIMQGCNNLQSLNISWSNLCPRSVQTLSRTAPTRLFRLNVAGCRRTLTDQLLEALCNRCTRLIELDVSDCSCLSAEALPALRTLQLRHLALSRAYAMAPRSLYELRQISTLQFLEVWGMLTDSALEALKSALPGVQINQFRHSAIARPTVGTRRTSIWGLRTRD